MQEDDQGLLWEPLKTAAVDLMVLSGAAALAWWFHSIELAILVAVIVGFAFNAANEVFLANAQSFKYRDNTNVLIALLRKIIKSEVQE